MNETESKHLQELLTTFKATCLGEGDTNAGANLLVAMTVNLANGSRTGSGIQTKELGRLRVGTSLLVGSGLTSSLVLDKVITEAITCQNNLVAQIRRLKDYKIADAERKELKSAHFPTGPTPNHAQNALYQLEQSEKESRIHPSEARHKWETVIGLQPNPRIDDLAARPKILVTARNSRDLESQLRGLHDNHPLVVLGLNSPADAAALSETCTSLLNGLLPHGDGGEMVTGNLLITDHCDVLAKIAPNAGDKTTWLGRMPWLVDGNTGPDAVEADAGQRMVRVADMTGYFIAALTGVLAGRMNNHDASPTVHDFDLGAAQLRWVRFLQEMESSLPGITGTARSLLASLAFGLIELARAIHKSNSPNPFLDPPPLEDLPVKPAGVEGLARWIILRMGNARAAMLGTAEREMLQRLAKRIVARLSDGNQSTREIYRGIGVNVAMAERLLLPMQRGGLLHRSEDKWGLSKDAALLMDDVQNLFIDV
jgi:hypothetical protein